MYAIVVPRCLGQTVANRSTVYGVATVYDGCIAVGGPTGVRSVCLSVIVGLGGRRSVPAPVIIIYHKLYGSTEVPNGVRRENSVRRV